MLFNKIINSKVGYLHLIANDNALLSISFTNNKHFVKENTNYIIEETVTQLNEYFEGKRKYFTIKLSPKGTDFQKQVWNELLNIPYGKTASYSDIAIAIGNPKAVRAIGNANNKNPIPIIIPCHRIIGKNRKLIGYAGGLDIKKALLNLEYEM